MATRVTQGIRSPRRLTSPPPPPQPGASTAPADGSGEDDAQRKLARDAVGGALVRGPGAASSGQGTSVHGVRAGQRTRAAQGPRGTSSIQALYDDPQFKALYAFAVANVQRVQREHLEWDRLGQVKAFAAAARFVAKGEGIQAPVASAPLLERFSGAQERRAITHLLLLLMPASDRSERPLLRNGTRGPAQDLFAPFPDVVIARADDGFQLRAGDVPHIASVFSAHLQRDDVLDRIFRPGQRGLFLASKRYCPGAFVQDRRDKNPPSLEKTQQAGLEGDPLMVHIDEIVERGSKRMARVHVPPQHKQWLGDDGAMHQGHEVLGRVDVVLKKDGSPALDAHGQQKPILIPLDHLADYLLDEGDSARTLRLGQEEDRALAIAFGETLKNTWFTDTNGVGKSLFDWLEQADQRTPRADVERIREGVREAAFQTVVRFTTHPRRTHFRLDVDPRELQAVQSGHKALHEADWQTQALLELESTGLCTDEGNYYEKDKDNAQHVHELAWTGEVLRAGFIGGSLDCEGSADAYDKLSKTFLEPMGVITTTGIAEGHGAALVRVLGQPDDYGVVQVGVPMKVKTNELILGLDLPIASGRGPAAQYMENWGGYVQIDGVVGERVDFVRSGKKLERLRKGVGS